MSAPDFDPADFEEPDDAIVEAPSEPRPLLHPSRSPDERDVLSALCLRRSLNGCDLTIQDFTDPAHRAIFASMLRLDEERKPIDVALLRADLAEHGDLDRAGGLGYLADLALAEGVIGSSLPFYSALVHRSAWRRRLAAYGERLYQAAQNGQPDDEIAGLVSALSEIGHRSPSQPTRDLKVIEMMKEPEPVPWLIPDWLVSGEYHVLGGQGKVGKSWIALHTTLVLASGCGEWLGRVAPQGGPRRVLYVDEEQGDSLVLRRLHALARGLGMPHGAVGNLPLKYLIRNGLNLEDRGDLQALLAVVEDFRPDLVVIDTLVRIHRSNENEAAPMRNLYATAIVPLLDRGCTVLGLAHLNKPSRDGPKRPTLDINRIRGSSELVNAADSIWCVQARTKHLNELHLVAGRHGEADPLGLLIKDQDGGVVVRGVPIQAPTDDLRPKQKEVLAYLSGCGQEGSPAHEISSQTGISRSTVQRILGELDRLSLVCQTGRKVRGSPVWQVTTPDLLVPTQNGHQNCTEMGENDSFV